MRKVQKESFCIVIKFWNNWNQLMDMQHKMYWKGGRVLWKVQLICFIIPLLAFLLALFLALHQMKHHLIPPTTSMGTSIKRPMTKLEMLQSQSKSLTTIANKLTASVEEQEVLLKTKVDVIVEKKCIQNSQFKGK